MVLKIDLVVPQLLVYFITDSVTIIRILLSNYNYRLFSTVFSILLFGTLSFHIIFIFIFKKVSTCIIPILKKEVFLEVLSWLRGVKARELLVMASDCSYFIIFPLIMLRYL